MSLFGDDEDVPRLAQKPTQNKSSLFDEDKPSSNRNSSSLFAEEDSPWGIPTPKKAGRAQLVKQLLQGADVPDVYIDLFDSSEKQGSGVKLAEVKKVLAASGLSEDLKERILSLVLPAGEEGASRDGVGRNEFNVFLALIGLAQEGEEVGLDAVDDRRRNLPAPKLNLPSTTPARARAPSATSSTAPQQASPAKQMPPPTQPAQPTPTRKAARQPSFGYDADPWASPDLHRGHNHAQAAPVASNGLTGAPHLNGGGLPQRTTSAFTTTSIGQDSTSGAPVRPATSGDNGWGGFEPSSGGEGFGTPVGGSSTGGGADDDPTTISRPVTVPRPGNGVEETIAINSLPEKEGMFMFQHRNYEVSSARRNSKVIRRYSDFVWLLDCLHKRYPFRQLPLLPPKRVAINGNYLAADTTFVEKRRRGLVRFANALVRHPVLSQEQLVIMFLTVPTELAGWRKQATISVSEEFVGRPLPPGLEDSLPANLEELFETVRSGVRRSAETYINLSNQMERLTKRNEGMAAEYARFSSGLATLTEASRDTYGLDTNDVPLLNEGLNATARHLNTSQSLLEDEAKAWDEGVLEDLKKQRDCLVSVRDMFERRDKYDRDNIPQLERRIASNENKLSGLRNRPEGQGKPGDIEKVEDAILKDKQSIVAQSARHVFVKECLRDELRFFQQSQYAISRLHQDWAQERVKYAELQAECWRGLVDEVEHMP